MNSETHSPMLIAGPCSAETRTQTLATAAAISKYYPQAVFRAGIWKPRTNPGFFEGVGHIGLQWLQEVKKQTGLRTATEIGNAAHAEACLKHDVDIVWIGARTTVSPFAVQEIADALRNTNAKVFVKNPVNADLKLWFGAMERLMQAGINYPGAIHRGFHQPGNTVFRNVPMWTMVSDFRVHYPGLPMLCDPSHICGNRELIPYVMKQANDVGVDGWMIETHIEPELALSDAAQQVTPHSLYELLGEQVSVNHPASHTGELSRLRMQISQTDQQLLVLLRQRMLTAKQIGRYKRAHNLPLVQPERWQELMNEHFVLSEILGIEKELVDNLFAQIHHFSVLQQKNSVD